MRGLLRRTLLTGLVGCGLLLLPGIASAATTIGQTFTPDQEFGGAGVFIQTGSPSNGYAVPTDGVITSWSFQAAATEAPPLKLKMLRRVNATDFATVGDSQLETPTLGALTTWPTRIPVKAGDAPAEFYSNSTLAYRDVPGFVTQEDSTGVDPPPGTTFSYESANPESHQIDLAAVLEPDADHDGYGDETQDGCPTNPALHSGCGVKAPPPISKQRKCKKHKHHRSAAIAKKKCKKKRHH
jgi:hypothetical protein